MNQIKINSTADLKLIKSKSGFDDIDIEFAKFLSRLTEIDDPILALTAVLASYALRNNHICLRLEQYATTQFPPEFEDDFQQNYIILPEISEWINHLKSFSKVISFSGDVTPLVVDEKNRLYIQRYFKYEQDLFHFLSEKLQQNDESNTDIQPPDISQLSKYFQDNNEIDYQQIAVLAALQNHFTVITGSPGSGKTTVVATILAAYFQNDIATKVGICAPTGKAAARLKESLTKELDNLNVDQSVKEKIAAIETSTIHRLLRTKYNTPHFIYGKDKKLDIDLLILDEASMVSLPLICKLFYALKSSTKVVLLGDKDQLASVEEGSVFGDICDSLPINSYSQDFCTTLSKCSNQNVEPNSNNSFANTIVELKRSHRFDNSKGIGLAKEAINSDDVQKVLSIGKIQNNEFVIKSLPQKNFLKSNIINYLKNLTIEIDSQLFGFKDYFHLESIEEKFQFMNSFRILCAKRNGIFGVNNINRIIIEQYFNANELYSDGIPIMITSNDSRLKLFNGDVGIVKKDGRSTKIYFPNPKESGKFRSFTPSQIPEHEPVFAMTIHKSQGSGFQKVLLIMPQKDSALLTRELFYTGITRAEKNCEIWSYDSIITSTINRVTKRDSGLKDLLLNFQK